MEKDLILRYRLNERVIYFYYIDLYKCKYSAAPDKFETPGRFCCKAVLVDIDFNVCEVDYRNYTLIWCNEKMISHDNDFYYKRSEVDFKRI